MVMNPKAVGWLAGSGMGAYFSRRSVFVVTAQFVAHCPAGELMQERRRPE